MLGLGLAGGTIGALKGATERDPYGGYISTGERLRRVAANAGIGGALGVGAGAVGKAYAPQMFKGLKAAPAPSVAKPNLVDNMSEAAQDLQKQNRSTANTIEIQTQNQKDLVEAARKKAELAAQERTSNAAARQAAVDARKAEIDANAQMGVLPQFVDNVVGTVKGEAEVIGHRVNKIANTVKNVTEKPRTAIANTLNNAALADIPAAPKPDVNDLPEAPPAQPPTLLSNLAGRAGRDTSRVVNGIRSRIGFAYDLDQTAKFLGYKSYKSACFMADPLTYKTLAIGTGIGGGIGSVLGASSAIQNNRLRNQRRLESIYNIEDPRQRVEAYDRYTSNPDLLLRQSGDVADTLINTGLGTGVGAMVGGTLLGGGQYAVDAAKRRWG